MPKIWYRLSLDQTAIANPEKRSHSSRKRLQPVLWDYGSAYCRAIAPSG
ncbi:MAG: hypothetical protein F6K41_04380 [Symploca sp. SIO3E6]|nr:hypothetical protein [Caldora sp. SIO3E6]